MLHKNENEAVGLRVDTQEQLVKEKEAIMVCNERVLMYGESGESFKNVAALEIGPELHALKG